MHEDLSREHRSSGGSDRSFGLVFTAVFLVVGLWPLVGGGSPRAWALAVAAMFVVVAIARPALLGPLNRLWNRFGLLLHRIVSPVVLGFLFYGTVTPMALLLRFMGKDPLRIRIDKAAASYWIERIPPGPSPESIRNQF